MLIVSFCTPWKSAVIYSWIVNSQKQHWSSHSCLVWDNCTVNVTQLKDKMKFYKIILLKLVYLIDILIFNAFHEHCIFRLREETMFFFVYRKNSVENLFTQLIFYAKWPLIKLAINLKIKSTLMFYYSVFVWYLTEEYTWL